MRSVLSVAVCLTVLLAGVASATTYNFYTTKAVNLRTDASTANQNTYDLVAGTANGQTYMSLIEFDLSAIPAGEAADLVVLRMYSRRTTGTTTVTHWEYPRDFSETSANWSNTDRSHGAVPLATAVIPNGTQYKHTGFSIEQAMIDAVNAALTDDGLLRLAMTGTGGLASLGDDEPSTNLSYVPLLQVVTVPVEQEEEPGDLAAVPEPMTLGCAAMSLLGLGGYVRRRRAR